jgi:hypothetical protein
MAQSRSTQIISMIKWIQTRGLSIKTLSLGEASGSGYLIRVHGGMRREMGVGDCNMAPFESQDEQAVDRSEEVGRRTLSLSRSLSLSLSLSSSLSRVRARVHVGGGQPLP